MSEKNKTINFNLAKSFSSVFCSFSLIGIFWVICSTLHRLGCPFPRVEMSKFSDLGFFALSNFSFITFLSMIPFQMAEGKLSPGFYSRFVNRRWSHFGLYILISSFISCHLVLTFYDKNQAQINLGPLFIAIVTSVIFAVVFHRYNTLRYLYQPMIVYENFEQLVKKESYEEVWLELYECTLKAVKENRISNAISFLNLMAKVFSKVSQTGKQVSLIKDLQSLHQAAKGQNPVASHMEKTWAFLRFEGQTVGQEPLVENFVGVIQ